MSIHQIRKTYPSYKNFAKSKKDAADRLKPQICTFSRSIYAHTSNNFSICIGSLFKFSLPTSQSTIRRLSTETAILVQIKKTINLEIVVSSSNRKSLISEILAPITVNLSSDREMTVDRWTHSKIILVRTLIPTLSIMNIAQINYKSLRNKSKQLDQYLYGNDISVAYLSETYLQPHN